MFIADREPSYRHLIRQQIGRYSGFRMVGECDSGYDVVRHINALEPDILILDVQLGGTKIVEAVMRADHLPVMILTATNEAFVMEAFEKQAVDYLLKPHSVERLDAALHKVVARGIASIAPAYNPPRPYHQHVFVEDGDRLRRIALDDILYMKAAGDYTVVYTPSGEYISTTGIGAIEKKLDPLQLMRVHRSFVVNIAQVETCNRDIGRLFLVMSNGHEIRVGKHYVHTVKTLIL